MLGAKGSASIHCEADVPEAISATWDTHENILVAQLHNKFCHIDLRKSQDKDKKRDTRKLVTKANGDEVSGWTVGPIRLNAVVLPASSPVSCCLLVLVIII